MTTSLSSAEPSFRRSPLPAFVLVFLAPMLAEVLPGATRFSAIFVLPIEMCVWGGGALLIREAARRWQLGWRNVLALALALALAEECLIQQTSLAPMVLQLKGQVYARAFGVNYVYLLWALVYETVFVVFLPIQLAELIFPRRRDECWLGRTGLIVTSVLFMVGAFLAWFSWTQIARPKVFHVPAFTPPIAAVVVAGAAIAILVYAGIGPFRESLARAQAPLASPPSWVIGTAGGVWAVLWYGLVVLGFGIAPQFPPWLAIAAGVALVVAILAIVPRWVASGEWSRRDAFSMVFGTMLGAMLVSFVGFIGAAPMDLYFKIGADAIAVALMLWLGARVRTLEVAG
jgi:hypothetical protein